MEVWLIALFVSSEFFFIFYLFFAMLCFGVKFCKLSNYLEAFIFLNRRFAFFVFSHHCIENMKNALNPAN
jgi:hypothetical protein